MTYYTTEGDGRTRRVRRTAVAFVLSLAGLVADALYTSTGPGDYWWPLLVVTPGGLLLALLTARTAAGRAAAYVAAVATTLVAVLLLPFGFGVWQLPAAVAMWRAARSR